LKKPASREGGSLAAKSLEVYKALSIEARRKILDLLIRKGPLDLEECSKIVKIKPITVRHHIRVLEQAGFVEAFTVGREAPGRPRQYYRAVKRYVNLGFPTRRFDLLSEQALKALTSKIGAKEAEKLLQAEAEKLGKELLSRLSAKHGVQNWDFEKFKKYVYPALEELGCYPLIEEGNGKFTLKFFNCIYYEISKKFHPIVCNAHEAFLKPLAEASGFVKEDHESFLSRDEDACVIRFKAKP